MTETATRLRLENMDVRLDAVLGCLWHLGWEQQDGSRLWMVRDINSACETLGIVPDYLRNTLRLLEAEGRIIKLQRGLWQIHQTEIDKLAETAAVSD